MERKKYDYLIVGSGLFGCVFAQQTKLLNRTCLVIDKRPQLGGNIYCKEMDRINVHLYGAHIFHTDKKEIWDYVNQFVTFNNYINSPLAYYKGKIYNLPFNMNTFHALWGVNTPQEAKAKIEEQRGEFANIDPVNLEEQALKLCGRDIYEILIKGYTEKQWGRDAKDLPPFIIRRVPMRFTYNNNYFDDPFQGIPIGGYNKLIDNLLDGIETITETNYFDNKEYFDSICNKVLFTGRIDEFFNYKFGELEYRSLRFEHQHLDMPDYQGNAVVNYNEKEVPYTRIIEHKHFEFGSQPSTIITKEYPDSFSEGKEPYYPINDSRNKTILEKYKKEAEQSQKYIFGGRLGQYAYYDMDDIVYQALQLAKKESKEK
jgi:UDP-galactopyranose mutase